MVNTYELVIVISSAASIVCALLGGWFAMKARAELRLDFLFHQERFKREDSFNIGGGGSSSSRHF